MSCACAFRVRSFQLAAFSFLACVHLYVLNDTRLVHSVAFYVRTLPRRTEITHSSLQTADRPRYPRKTFWRILASPQFEAKVTSAPNLVSSEGGSSNGTFHIAPTILLDSTRNYAGRIVTRGAGNLWSSWPRSPMATPNKTSGPGAGIWLSAFPRGHTTACHGIGKLLHDVGKT